MQHGAFWPCAGYNWTAWNRPVWDQTESEEDDDGGAVGGDRDDINSDPSPPGNCK